MSFSKEQSVDEPSEVRFLNQTLWSLCIDAIVTVLHKNLNERRKPHECNTHISLSITNSYQQHYLHLFEGHIDSRGEALSLCCLSSEGDGL